MANIKQYTIQINGIEQSISAVDALNKQLDALEKKIDALQGKAVNAASTSSGGGSRTAELSDEDKLLKQIEATQARINQADMADYKVLLGKKQELKELVTEQKSMTAEARLTEGAYANTMQGMKQHLADIKAAMQTVDLGDTDTFKKLTKDANELNQKLLEIEKSYGQFGRNVGNYASAAEGFKTVKITVGDTVREFNSAREASRTLNEELKALALNGQANTKEADKLRQAIRNAESAMKDATISSKAMDEAMDWMESFTAMGSIGQGFKAFFGIDDNEITKSIQKLVSLQSVLKGIETIRKQMDTGEGIGGMLAKGNKGIDAATHRLLVYNRALLGTGKAAKVAAAGINLLGKAMKAIKAVAIFTAVSVAIEKITKLFDKTTDKVEGLTNAIEKLNDTYREQEEILKTSYLKGEISDEQYLNQIYSQRIQQLQEMMTYQKQLAKNSNSEYESGVFGINGLFGMNVKHGWQQTGGAWGTFGAGHAFNFDSFDTTIDIQNLEQAEAALRLLNKALEDGGNNWEYYAKQIEGYDGSLFSTYGDIVKIHNEIAGRSVVEALDKTINSMQGLSIEMDNLSASYASGAISEQEYGAKLEQMRTKAKELRDAFVNNDIYSSIILHLPEFIQDTEVCQQIQNMIDMVNKFADSFGQANPKIEQNWAYFTQVTMKRGLERTIAQIEWNRKQYIAENQITGERLLQVNEEFERQKQEATAQFNEQELSRQQAHNREVIAEQQRHNREYLEAEKDLISLRIQNMEEGLRKTITQLEEERKQKISKVRQSGIMVGERELQIQKLYMRKIEDARKEHLNNLKKQYEDIWKEINTTLKENLDEQAEMFEKQDKQVRASLNRGDYFRNVYSYGIQGKNSLSKGTLRDLGIASMNTIGDDSYIDDMYLKNGSSREVEKYTKEFTKQINKLMDLQRQVEYLKRRIEAETLRGKNTDELKKELEEAERLYDEHFEYVKEYYYRHDYERQMELLRQESYSKRLVDIAHQRYAAMDAYWEKRLKIERDQSQKEYEAAESAYTQEYEANEQYLKDQTRLISSALTAQMTILNEQLQNRQITENEYRHQEALANEEALRKQEALEKQYNTNLETIEKNWKKKQEELEEQSKQRILEIESEKLQDILQYYRDYYTALNNLEQRQLVTNEWGIINISKTKKNAKELVDSYKEMAEALRNERIWVEGNEILSDEEKEAAIREIDSFQAELGDRLDAAKGSLRNLTGEFIASLNTYIQTALQSLQTIMDAFNDLQDYEWEKEEAQLDKQTEELEKKYQEQEKLAEEHKNNVESIEDELSNARGDRRQQLIDSLNAEMAAQRRALAEQKRVEKEQQRLEEEKERLDKKRKEAEYKRNLQSILVSGAMAAANGLATQPFVPVGIAMGALAASLAAVQYALAKQQKPYADGGVIVGRSHKEGGVPVLGGRASVEGGEFITNKVTTAKNVGLLEYINSKRRKVDIADLLEFYNSGRPSKSIASVRTRFADGGVIPQLRSDISFNDRLITAFEDYSNRPQYVQVVDIIDQTERLNEVKVISGLEV